MDKIDAVFVVSSCARHDGGASLHETPSPSRGAAGRRPPTASETREGARGAAFTAAAGGRPQCVMKDTELEKL